MEHSLVRSLQCLLSWRFERRCLHKCSWWCLRQSKPIMQVTKEFVWLEAGQPKTVCETGSTSYTRMLSLIYLWLVLVHSQTWWYFHFPLSVCWWYHHRRYLSCRIQKNKKHPRQKFKIKYLGILKYFSRIRSGSF